MLSQIKCAPTSKYVAGQQVWLFMWSWQLQLLEVRWIGLFEVQEVLHNTCQLCLPSMLKIHPVINITYLKLASSMTANDSKRPVFVSPNNLANPKWEVKQIVAHHHQGC